MRPVRTLKSHLGASNARNVYSRGLPGGVGAPGGGKSIPPPPYPLKPSKKPQEVRGRPGEGLEGPGGLE